MGTLLEDVRIASNWVSTALTHYGYDANFQPESLHEVERFFTDHCVDGGPRPSGLLAEDFGRRLFALGAYVGEVIRLAKDGKWVLSPEDPNSEIEIEVHLEDDSRCWPIERVMQRVRNGPEDSLVAYGVGLGILPAQPIKLQ